MFLAVDIGNSNIKFGIFDGSNLVKEFSIPTSQSIGRFLIDDGPRGRVERAMFSSVVPRMNAPLAEAVTREFGIEPIVVTADMDFGLNIRYQPPSAAGTDRLVNCFSAVEKYGAPCIICSFGTALTIDVVTSGRDLIGGIIAPGMGPLAAALKLTTAQLPEVKLDGEPPSPIVQDNTEGSIRSGIVNGYLGLFEGLIAGIKSESEPASPVIATGGHAKFVSRHSTNIDVVDPYLTLNGLRLLSERIA